MTVLPFASARAQAPDIALALTELAAQPTANEPFVYRPIDPTKDIDPMLAGTVTTPAAKSAASWA